MITKLREKLGLDTPFRAVTDHSPPPAPDGSGMRMAAIAAARGDLLERVIAPYSSPIEETRLKNDIRRHLRETRRRV